MDMDAGLTLHEKTPLGAQEMSARRMKLAPRLRMLLILVDGSTVDARLAEEGHKIGAPVDALHQLRQLGLVRPVASGQVPVDRSKQTPSERFTEGKRLMTASAASVLGLKSFLFILKLEKAGTVEDLRELAPAFLAAVERADGPEAAEVLKSRLAAILGGMR